MISLPASAAVFPFTVMTGLLASSSSATAALSARRALSLVASPNR